MAHEATNSVNDRRARVTALLEQITARRLAGEPVSDADLIDAHPELAPVLAEKLSALHVVEQARKLAESPPDPPEYQRRSAGNRDAGFPAVLLDSLSGYEVLRRIKGGGQGVVFEAPESESTRSA